MPPSAAIDMHERRSPWAKFADTDLIIEGNPRMCRYRGGDNGLEPFPASMHNALEELFKALREQHASMAGHGGDNFRLRHDNDYYRVTPIETGYDDISFNLRRVLSAPLPVDALGIHSRVLDRLKECDSGLIVFFGAFSSGKTTAASSYLADYIKRIGGYGLTIEDPPEILMSGDYGRGRIRQIAAGPDDLERKAVKTLRTSFDAMLISEVRTPQMALEVAKNASVGRLLFTTIHADNLVAGMTRLVSYVSTAAGNGDAAVRMARQTLADCFRGAVLMRKFPGGGRGGSAYLLGEDSVADNIRHGDFESLKNSTNKLHRILTNNMPFEPR